MPGLIGLWKKSITSLLGSAIDPAFGNSPPRDPLRPQTVAHCLFHSRWPRCPSKVRRRVLALTSDGGYEVGLGPRPNQPLKPLVPRPLKTVLGQDRYCPIRPNVRRGVSSLADSREGQDRGAFSIDLRGWQGSTSMNLDAGLRLGSFTSAWCRRLQGLTKRVY